VVVDRVEVDLVQARLAAPRRHRARQEVVERPVAELPHPVRLALVRGDRVDQLVRQAPPRLVEVVLGNVEAVLDAVVGADLLDDLVLGLSHQAGTSSVSHSSYPDTSSFSASSAPPSSTNRPSTNTCTKSGRT